MNRLEPGATFGGFTIESLLGRGGMGAVYLATHERLERKVALKVIASDLAHDEAFRARFLEESRLAASLDHRNVIPIYDAGEIDGLLYIAMRYVKGPSLFELLRTRDPLSPEETARIATQIGGALDAAHAAGLAHRDVKPANILLAEPDEHAYLCDFGLAKRASSEGATQTGFFLGTSDYCSPEQIRSRPLDGRADVYSLGCVVYHCLTGEPPYRRDSEFAVLEAHLSDPPPRVTDARSDLSRALDGVVATAMAKDPDARFQTTGELASALESAVRGGEATRAAPVQEPGSRTARVPRRTAWMAALAVLAAAVLIGAAIVVLATTGSSSAPDTAADAELQTFVDRVENVLRQSAAGRNEIGSALAAGFDCSISAREAGRRIASVADNRQSILEQLGSLQAPSAEAAAAVTLLQRALQDSIEADRHYRDGFFAIPTGTDCPLPRNEGFGLAARSDARATAAKLRFVKAFNPLAEEFDRRTWTPREI